MTISSTRTPLPSTQERPTFNTQFSQAITEPRKLFASLNTYPTWLAPLLLLTLSTAAVSAWYYSVVDFEWLKEQALLSIADVNVRETARLAIQRPMLLTSALMHDMLLMPLGWALMALYLFCVSKLLAFNRSFRQWFALVVWSNMPHFLLLVSGAAQILLSTDGQISTSQVHPLSLNQLVLQLRSGPWIGLAEAIDVGLIWSIMLLALGVRSWTRRSWPTCLAIALLPPFIVYGGWALVISLGFIK
ncbi:YIP1 family protein [Janthinobacterium sp. UMAB-60]|uniref:YIP1 family protein n=1 Tax=Janthinobacterium sp. UMAB-60 TaxID=1365365 RepID=UPI001C5A2A32|nr:YIP1 family protein [Janthinobacterium sp. UMAB-60]